MFDCVTPSPQLVVVGLPRASGPESVVEGALFRWLSSLLFAPWADPGWSGCHFRDDVARLLGLCAGPELMAALAALPGGRCSAAHDPGDGIDIGGTPPHGSPGNPCVCLLALAAAWQACSGYATAGARAAVVDAVGAEPVVLPRDGVRPELADPAREELALALRLSPGSASTRINQSRELAALPQVGGLVREGLLTDGSATRIADGLSRLSAEDADRCAGELSRRVRLRLERGKRAWNGSDVADCARRLSVRCPSYTQARKQAVARRRVERWSNGDGTASLQAVLPDLVAERIFRRLTAIATGLDDDGRSMDARRADVLADLLLGGEGSRATGVEVNVVISAEALLGLAQTPAEVPGLGPVPAEHARELAADAKWVAWVRDARGSVTATGSRGYQPAAAVARLVRARESHCRMPGCRLPAARCDLDHAVPYPAGATTVQNLGPLCRRHHILKTHAGWRLDATDPQQQTWTTPAGASLEQQPDPPWLDEFQPLPGGDRAR